MPDQRGDRNWLSDPRAIGLKVGRALDTPSGMDVQPDTDPEGPSSLVMSNDHPALGPPHPSWRDHRHRNPVLSHQKPRLALPDLNLPEELLGKFHAKVSCSIEGSGLKVRAQPGLWSIGMKLAGTGEGREKKDFCGVGDSACVSEQTPAAPTLSKVHEARGTSCALI
jgi:hypothetical protein